MRFTLVELMIVVAIIGVLASIAIPAFAEFQLKAKRAEVAPNVAAMSDAAFAVAMELPLGDSLAYVGHPRDYSAAALDKVTEPWGAPGEPWSSLGWAPDGAVRGSYSGQAVSLLPGPAQSFALGATDIDDDDQMWVHSERRIGTGSVTTTLLCRGGGDCQPLVDAGCDCY